MGAAFAWATKEYLLWKMSLGQIVMYWNLYVDSKTPRQEGGDPSVKNMSPEQVRKLRDELRAQYGEIG
jgi:hypothetical protein